MSYKVKDIRKFIKSVVPYNKFNLGDIVFIEPNTVGVVIGYTENGEVITDVGTVGIAKYANIYEIEKHRNNLIPHIGGTSYVMIRNTEDYTTQYVFVDKSTALEEFKYICINLNVPVDGDNYIAGGRQHGYLLTLFVN